MGLRAYGTMLVGLQFYSTMSPCLAFLVKVEFEPRALCLLDSHSATELCP